MRLRWVLFTATLLAVWPAAAREKSDVLVMRNGDRLTCEIKSLTADTLYIKLDYALGTISVDWFKVDHLESNQLFLVKTQNGEVYTGKLSLPKAEGERPVALDIIEPDGPEVQIDRTRVTQIDQSFERFWHRFNGSIGLGATYSKANQTGQYSLSSDVEYPRERWAASASYKSNLTSNSGASTSTRNQIYASAYRLLRWNNWYYTGFAGFLQSTEQSISLQSTFGGGIGRYLVNTNRTSIMLAGGFAFQRINYQQETLVAPSQDVTSAWINSQVKLLQFDRTSLNVNASLLPALSDPGRVQFNMNAAYYIKIYSKLKFNISFYGAWDNRPPPSFSGSDYGTTVGVDWTFGNR